MPRGQTVTRWIAGRAPHQRSLATSVTAPSGSTESILNGPDEGKRVRSLSTFRSQMVFQASAIRATATGSPLWMPAVTSTPRASPITWDGMIDVAVNNWA